MASSPSSDNVPCLLPEQGAETYDEWTLRLGDEILIKKRPYCSHMAMFLRYHTRFLDWEHFQEVEAKEFLDLRLLLPDMGYGKQELDWKIRYYKEIFERRPNLIDDAARTDDVEKLPDFFFGEDVADTNEWHIAKLVAMRWCLKTMMPRLRDEIRRTSDYPMMDLYRPMPDFDDDHEYMGPKRHQLLQNVEKMLMEKSICYTQSYSDAEKFSAADEAMEALTNEFERRPGNDDDKLGSEEYTLSRHSPDPKKYFPTIGAEIYWICCKCKEKNLISREMRGLMRHQYVRPTCRGPECRSKPYGAHRFCAFEFKWDESDEDQPPQHCAPLRQRDRAGDTQVYELQDEHGMPCRSVNKWIKETWRFETDPTLAKFQHEFFSRWKTQIRESDSHFDNYADYTFRVWQSRRNDRADFASDDGFLEKDIDFKITDEEPLVV